MSTKDKSGTYLTPSERARTFARFARINQTEAQRRRLEILKEHPSLKPESSEVYLTGADKADHDEKQFSYAKSFQKEYQVFDDADCNTQDDESILENDSVRSLPMFKTNRGGLDQTSTIMAHSEVQGEEFTSEVDIEQLRRQYFSHYKINNSLPIYQSRQHLLDCIDSYSVVIVEGATGSGKTTQVPTYILENAIFERKQSRAPVVYVTQPRRIAAKSIAQRVCDEHGWEIGTIVGYQVGLEKRVGHDSILVYCTAGVLLQKLIHDKSLKNYTHIIIDEAHERDADTDLLMMMIRKLMRDEMSFFRLIVMSATMDLMKLKSYFTFKTNRGHSAVTAPSICKVGSGKSPSTVQIIYLEKMQNSFNINFPTPEFDIRDPELHEDCLKAAKKLIVEVIPRLDTYSEATKTTLVFLPGLSEIHRLHRMLRGVKEKLDIIPLHSCLSAEDQFRVFKPSLAEFRKVILATNIAESSITVKDAGFIVDFCLTKILRKDPVTNFPALMLDWSTMDKCTQRAGRTGRCCPGKVFRMITASFYSSFREYAQPELLVAPLELSVLRVKSFDMGDVIALLAIVLDPPPYEDIRRAVLELKQIGAISSTHNGKMSDIDGDLTELGRVIVVLPIDVHLSKLIAMATILDCLEDAIIVAACLSTNRSVVRHMYAEPMKTYVSKLVWAHGSNSDLLVSLDVYKRYMAFRHDQNKDYSWLASYCHDRNLDEKKLFEVDALIAELKDRLEMINIRLLEQPNRERDPKMDEFMLRIAVCAAFYPNYFLTKDFDTQQVRRDLCGLDPTETVIVHKLPVNEVPLYRTQIVNQLKGISEEIDFIADVSRAYLVFNNEKTVQQDHRVADAIEMPSLVVGSKKIKRDVFMAIKFADFDRIFIREYKSEIASERMDYYRAARARVVQNRTILLPSRIKLIVEGVADNSRFNDEDDDEVDTNYHNYYLEIPFNLHQANLDMTELFHLEEEEFAQQIEMSKPGAKPGHFKEIYSPTFKESHRAIGGPYSPIMMQFRSILDKSRGYTVDIDPCSVNSVLLDPDYDKVKRQMLVAASVTHTKTNKLLVRDTTLMPNIRGLPTLMSLLFAQYYRLVFNNQTKNLAGAIFGLGWDENDKPIDKNYEVELSFDVHITRNDIDMINKAREMFSELIRALDVRNSGAPMLETQARLKQLLLTLIKRYRCPLSEIPISEIEWQDGDFVKEPHNVPASQLTELGEGEVRVFLPVMESTVDFSDHDMFFAIRTNLDYLSRIASYEISPSSSGVRCLLCGLTRENLFILRNEIISHINSESHLENLKNYLAHEELVLGGPSKGHT